MKKLHFIFAVLVSMCMTSCLMSALNDVAKVTEEAEEIASGKCFTVKTGTITYEDGTIVTFKDYGKTWASHVEATGERIIVKDGAYYTLNVTDKVYYEEYYGDNYSGCPYIFWENMYEFGDDWGEENLKKSTEVIAGKKCTVFTAEDGSKVGGWERVLFLETAGDDMVYYRAVSWDASADDSLFSLEGYTAAEY